MSTRIWTVCVAGGVLQWGIAVSAQAADPTSETEPSEETERAVRPTSQPSSQASSELASSPEIVSFPKPQSMSEEDEQIVSLGGLPGTFRIPGTDVSLGFGGFIKADFIFSSRGIDGPGGGDFGNQFLVPSLIPLDGSANGTDNQLTFHVRESRIHFKAYSPTKNWGDFNAYLELDFLAFQAPGNERISDSHAPRVRHAFGSLGGLLIGQTWSTFMNASAIPENLDFIGSVGTIFARQPLIRYTQSINAMFSVVVALEQPETTLTSRTTGGRETTGDDRLPDIVLGATAKGAFGNVTLRFIGRELFSDDGTTKRTGYVAGASIAGRLKTAGGDTLRFNFNTGNGVGRRMGLNAVNDGYINPADEISGTKTIGGHLAYQHFWAPALRSSVTISFFDVFYPNATKLPVNGDQTEAVVSGIVNLLFSPIPRTTFGIEYLYAQRWLRRSPAESDRRNGTLHRGQFSGKFVF